jgi:REP-associated tyrosine transposase
MPGKRKTIRLKGYDYTQEGGYHVTVCTQNHECSFGTVRDEKMILNEYGEIIKQEWCKTEKIREYIINNPKRWHKNRGTSQCAPTQNNACK